MPNKLPGTLIYRFNREVPGLGRFQASAQTKNLTEFRRRDGILTKLIERGMLEPIHLLQAGALSWAELVEADRQDRLAHVVSDSKLDVPLWARVGELARDDGSWDDATAFTTTWLPVSAPARVSRRRYRTSMRKLRDLIAKPNLTVRELKALDWRLLRRRWSGSQADWNRMRAAISAFLTWLMGDEYHPARVEVVRLIPWKREPLGVSPNATITEFWAAVARTPDHAKPAYVAMLLLSAYPSEYTPILPEDLFPAQRLVVVNGRKTWARRREVTIDGDTAWAWITRAIPAPLQYGWLHEYWRRACAPDPETDWPGVLLPMKHLRHFGAQLAGDRGASDRDMAVHLGHSNTSTTHRYTRRRVMRGIAASISDQVFAGQEIPVPAQKSAQGGAA
jgi:integrase